ncbi:MAG: hypothetical protein MJZ77_01875 [Bacteroidales bacterium]|nr:hypothetical protein [Bacteroidales bacterium]
MTELVLTIEDETIIPSLRKVLGSMNGVTVKTTRKKKSGMELAMEDVKDGRVTEWNGTVEEMIDSILMK